MLQYYVNHHKIPGAALQGTLVCSGEWRQTLRAGGKMRLLPEKNTLNIMYL